MLFQPEPDQCGYGDLFVQSELLQLFSFFLCHGDRYIHEVPFRHFVNPPMCSCVSVYHIPEEMQEKGNRTDGDLPIAVRTVRAPHCTPSSALFWHSASCRPFLRCLSRSSLYSTRRRPQDACPAPDTLPCLVFGRRRRSCHNTVAAYHTDAG